MAIGTNFGCISESQYNPVNKIKQFLKEHIEIPNTMSSTFGGIPYFHQQICSLAYNIPLKSSWVLFIYPNNKDYLLKQISSLNLNYENKEWDIFNSAKKTTEDPVQNIIGCIFAQGVNLPGEDVGVEYAGITQGSKRGFINAPIINGRKDFEPLEVGFLETNSSFVDSFMRPWSILVAHKGLIATSKGTDIKATIIVHHLRRNGKDDSSSEIRKTFIFNNCAPIHIASETLDYSSSSDFPKLQVKFAYSRYAVTDSIYNSSDALNFRRSLNTADAFQDPQNNRV
jgi:hypothetical protein